MKTLVVTGSLLALLTASAGAASTSKATGLPDLPAWSQSDFEKLKRGELIPGQDFFGVPAKGDNTTGTPPDPEGSLPIAPSGEPEPEEYVTEISPLHLKRYFGALPRDPEGEPVLLIDPQELLAQQEYRDRRSFLQYHSAESKIDMVVYLFDSRQELPEEKSIGAVFDDLYSNYGSVAVVFYHLGSPERSQLVLSGDLLAAVSEDEQSRALRAAVQEAFEKSDAAYQLDNFLVELSIRLYWIEREMAGAIKMAAASVLSAGEGGDSASTGSGDKMRRMMGRGILFLAIMGGVAFLGWLGKFLVERRIRHVFPEVETGPLLGAPHAAGVGAVVSFSNAHVPPSQQRDQVPDYLQRM